MTIEGMKHGILEECQDQRPRWRRRESNKMSRERDRDAVVLRQAARCLFSNETNHRKGRREKEEIGGPPSAKLISICLQGMRRTLLHTRWRAMTSRIA